ncbi:hypothetical protein Sru01_24720 [Sphaerisporangium rufum]|uniref:PQ-loop repeat-containing protein n=1 Tax=Sphaerisporangium rufum TaxID=1381558 RepID=A0A919V4P8_9ACTN|nr:hypothetical protein [Sphaerisporangium rufum]GII77490.1 hypothetical protein Sru01_24720 [Sphaerisporangium rufum]
MGHPFDYLPFMATLFGIPQYLPQIGRLWRTRDPAGVSWAWAALTGVNNAAWFGYFTSSGYWTALVPSAAATLLAGTVAVLLARLGRAGLRSGAWVGAWAVLLAGSAAAAGPPGLGTVLTVASVVQVTPSVVTAYRAPRPTGVSPGTWLLVLGEVSCWTVYGLYRSDPRLIALGVTGITASVLMLARIRYAARRRYRPSPSARFR